MTPTLLAVYPRSPPRLTPISPAVDAIGQPFRLAGGMTNTTLTMAAGAIDAVKIYGGGDNEVRALDGVTVGFEQG